MRLSIKSWRRTAARSCKETRSETEIDSSLEMLFRLDMGAVDLRSVVLLSRAFRAQEGFTS